jgi:hypothetical protein
MNQIEKDLPHTTPGLQTTPDVSGEYNNNDSRYGVREHRMIC